MEMESFLFPSMLARSPVLKPSEHNVFQNAHRNFTKLGSFVD